MSLIEKDRIQLPEHIADGGFDHAAIHVRGSCLYVAHPSNDSVDVVDLQQRRLLRSLPGYRGVAGVWVSEEAGLLFTSNRGEDTAGILRLPSGEELFRVPTGVRPNGLACDPGRNTLLVAGVGNAASEARPTATWIDFVTGARQGQCVLPGRTRWATYHPATDAFYVNIADPPQIVALEAGDPSRVAHSIPIPATGPHGLEQDPNGKTLFCASDDGRLLLVDLRTRTATVEAELSGPPDVIWLDPGKDRLYVAIGDPGVIDVLSTSPLGRVETVRTAPGAHTLTVDLAQHDVHVFLPGLHEDLVLHED